MACQSLFCVRIITWVDGTSYATAGQKSSTMATVYNLLLRLRLPIGYEGYEGDRGRYIKSFDKVRIASLKKALDFAVFPLLYVYFSMLSYMVPIVANV